MRNGHRDVPIASSMMIVAGTAFVTAWLVAMLSMATTSDAGDWQGRSAALFVGIALVLAWMLFLGVREIGVLAERWDSPLARPALWTALTASLLILLVIALASEPAGSETTTCTGTKCETSRDTFVSVWVLAVFIGGTAVALVAIGLNLFTTWRSMRRAV